jgi:hypothetical protein
MAKKKHSQNALKMGHVNLGFPVRDAKNTMIKCEYERNRMPLNAFVPSCCNGEEEFADQETG